MQQHQKADLYFIGFKGAITNLESGAKNVSYVLDSNLVLKLIRSHNKNEILSSNQQHFYQVSMRVANKEWGLSNPKIAINPVLAILELTKQHKKVDYKRYELMFNELLQSIYGVYGYDPIWVNQSYLAAMQALVSIHPSIVNTVMGVWSYIDKVDKPTDIQIISGCEKFLNWIWRNQEQLVLIGGPLLYVSMYAIAGSPDAQLILKVKKARKENDLNSAKLDVANNVAWDFLYWVLQELEYHRAELSDVIVCTSDRPLARLLSSRINQGIRSGINSNSPSQFIETHGDFYPFKFKRLESTKLEKKLEEMLISFHMALIQNSSDSFKFGFNSYVC